MKIKIIMIALIICHFYIPSVAYNSFKLNDDYNFAKSKFSWLKKDFYYYLDLRCKGKDIDPIFALSVVQHESNGKNIISKQNRNGSIDVGFFQINSVHMPKNPRKLLNYRLNTRKALWYMSLCLKKAKGDKYLACIYYNGGLNCNVRRYKRNKNKDYPKRILKTYYNICERVDI